MSRALLSSWICCLATLTYPVTATAQPARPQTILLWPDGAPGALGQTDEDKPTLTIYTVPATSPWKVTTGVVVVSAGIK